jgi:hypothetical protein
MLGEVLPVLRFVPFVFHSRFIPNVALFVVTRKPIVSLLAHYSGQIDFTGMAITSSTRPTSF